MSSHDSRSEHPTLLANAISLGGDWVASVANVAPSSSVAFTLALLVGLAGLASPLAVALAGLAMLLVAVGYSRLNNWKPHAGAPFIWVGETVSPVLGYATGILAVLAATVANIGNITLAGTYLLGILSPGTTFANPLVWVLSAAIMALVVYIAVLGIRPSIRVQTSIIVFEYAVVILFVLLSLKREIIDHVAGTTAPSLNAFAIHTSPTGLAGVIGALVICGFLYAGWEAPLVLGEESKDAHFNPGRAAILGVVFLTVWYTFLIIVFQGVDSTKAIAANSTDFLGYAGRLLLPDPWGRLLSLAVLSAVFATTQMQLTESSRVTFAMARDRLLPKGLAVVHRTFRTPWVAAIVLGVIPPIALIPYLANAGATTAIGYVISADGLLYLIMYAIIAFACVWYYRRLLGTGTRHLVESGILPLVGGLANLGIFAYGLKTQTPQVSIVAGALCLACVVWAAIARVAIGSVPYFQRTTTAHDAAAPEPEREPTRV
ncbi:MAG TPA: APC family permease [Candidatus Limnocylindrales bacterium]|nr:APC family permease [Candidatus Limnocylindrales bacterium]